MRLEWTNDHREWYRDVYLKSEHWAELKARKLKESPQCRECGNCENLDVHHVNYRHLFDVGMADLLTLCRKCHDEHHEEAGMPTRRRRDFNLSRQIPPKARAAISAQEHWTKEPSPEICIPIHVDPERKSEYFQAAKASDMALTEWIIYHCDAAVFDSLKNGKRTVDQRPVVVDGKSLIRIKTFRARKTAYVWTSRPGKLILWMLDVLDEALAAHILESPLVTTRERKDRYLRAAAGRPLVQWIWETLDEADMAEARKVRDGKKPFRFSEPAHNTSTGSL